jgi:hypothetical protein
VLSFSVFYLVLAFCGIDTFLKIDRKLGWNYGFKSAAIYSAFLLVFYFMPFYYRPGLY